jgi:hypothetical protein
MSLGLPQFFELASCAHVLPRPVCAGNTAAVRKDTHLNDAAAATSAPGLCRIGYRYDFGRPAHIHELDVNLLQGRPCGNENKEHEKAIFINQLMFAFFCDPAAADSARPPDDGIVCVSCKSCADTFLQRNSFLRCDTAVHDFLATPKRGTSRARDSLCLRFDSNARYSIAPLPITSAF